MSLFLLLTYSNNEKQLDGAIIAENFLRTSHSQRCIDPFWNLCLVTKLIEQHKFVSIIGAWKTFQILPNLGHLTSSLSGFQHSAYAWDWNLKPRPISCSFFMFSPWLPWFSTGFLLHRQSMHVSLLKIWNCPSVWIALCLKQCFLTWEH